MMHDPLQPSKPMLTLDYTIDDYWAALYRRKWIILFVVIVAAVLSGWVSKQITPQYEATTAFYVPLDMGAGGVHARLPSGLQDHAKAYAEILKQSDTRAKIAQRFPGKDASRFRWDVDIVVAREGVIRIYVRDDDPQLAADIANGFADFFNEFHHDIILGDLARSLENIDKELAGLEDRIAKADARRRDFMEQHNISSMATLRVELERKRMGFDDALRNRRVDLQATTEQIESIRQQLALESKAYEAGRIILPNRVIHTFQETLARIEVEIARARTELKPDHPDFATLQNSYDQAKENYDNEVTRIAGSDSKLPGSLYADLRRRLTYRLIDRSQFNARIISWEEAIAEIDEQISRVPQMTVELGRRDQVLGQLHLSRTTFEAERSNLVARSLQMKQTGLVIDLAEAPLKPVFPVLSLNVGIAALIGLIIGIIYVLLLEHIDARQRVRKMKILEREQWAQALFDGIKRPKNSILEAMETAQAEAAPPSPSDES